MTDVPTVYPLTHTYIYTCRRAPVFSNSLLQSRLSIDEIDDTRGARSRARAVVHPLAINEARARVDYGQVAASSNWCQSIIVIIFVPLTTRSLCWDLIREYRRERRGFVTRFLCRRFEGICMYGGRRDISADAEVTRAEWGLKIVLWEA